MNIITDKNELQRALSTVSRATAVRNIGPLEGMLIEAYDDKLSIYATNKEIQISTIIDARVIVEGKILVKSKIINDIVRSFESGEVCIEEDENYNVTITCGNSVFNINSMDYRTFPNREVYNINDFIKIENNVMKNMIKETVFACATNESMSVSPILTGVLIENTDSGINFVAIDGFRMAIRTEEAQERYMNNMKCVVPSSTLNELSRILSTYEEDVFINISDKKFIATVGKTQLISSLLQGKFIAYKNLIPSESGTIVKMKKDDLMFACEKASIISDDAKAKLITLKFREGELEIFNKSKNGNYHDRLDISMNGNDIDISFNSRYLLDCLKVIDDENIIIELNSSKSPCLIKPVDSNRYQYLVMSVRMDG